MRASLTEISQPAFPLVLRDMTPVPVANVIAARMQSLLLADHQGRAPLDIARWFGAMQAQDAASGHWSLGVRSAIAAETDVVAAFEGGELIRTWPMRGTLHIVPGVDASWLLELTGVRAMAGAERRRTLLGLTLKDVERASGALAEELAARRLITRPEALAVIARAGIDTSGQRGYHLLWHAAQAGITCIGPQRGRMQTFALLADWAPAQVSLPREEALSELLLRYVRSHGPVSLKDFVGWTGLTITDARAAAKSNEGRLVPVATEAGELWATKECADALNHRMPTDRPVLVLPGFDELMLGYKDRTLHVPTGGMERIVPGGNGVFRATVVIDGIAAATWKRRLGVTSVDVEVHAIAPIKAKYRAAMVNAFERYAAFLGRRLTLHELNV